MPMSDAEWNEYLVRRMHNATLDIPTPEQLDSWPEMSDDALAIARHRYSYPAAVGEFDTESDE